MSISGQNLSIVIVTIKSEGVIDKCIESINKDLPIIVVENSNNSKFLNYLVKKYKNIRCILSKENLGMGRGNNLGIKEAKTDYVLILNPDVILEHDTIDELILASKNILDFSILSPISSNTDYPNYKMDDNQKKLKQKNLPFKVNAVDGYAMLFNKKKIDNIVGKESLNFGNNYFDENFFMYLENNDLCKRLIEKDESIFVVPKAKINHLGAKAVNSRYNKEIELSRNWHWIWSKFYFKKKHFGFFKAFLEDFPNFILSILKYIIYLIINNKVKKNIYFNRASGFFNSVIGKSSWYRPNLDD
jgi:N-acetylglucosaminyl-diphospho-decaprenol L-rhamnosyltransferase